MKRDSLVGISGQVRGVYPIIVRVFKHDRDRRAHRRAGDILHAFLRRVFFGGGVGGKFHTGLLRRLREGFAVPADQRVPRAYPGAVRVGGFVHPAGDHASVAEQRGGKPEPPAHVQVVDLRQVAYAHMSVRDGVSILPERHIVRVKVIVSFRLLNFLAAGGPQRIPVNAFPFRKRVFGADPAVQTTKRLQPGLG